MNPFTNYGPYGYETIRSRPNYTQNPGMDSLAETPLYTSFCPPESDESQHPRFSQYKPKWSAQSQEERRKRFLEEQKSKREKQLLAGRNLGGGKDETPMDVSTGSSASSKKAPRQFIRKLMMSEWLLEVPSDLEEEWLFVLCPVGKRCLVSAGHGVTKAYSRSGFVMNTFPSFLPDGNKAGGEYSSGCTILDCFYNESEKTYYVLDVISWRGIRLVDSETEFRLFWVRTKLDECPPQLREKVPQNPCSFVALPNFACRREEIQRVLWSPMPFSCDLDGLLFFHKRTHYMEGRTTPLVCWLKAFMCPEILGVAVPDNLCKDRPPSYVSMQQHLHKAFKKHRKRKEAEEARMEQA